MNDPSSVFESELFGAPRDASDEEFGYSLYDRTYGLGAVQIEWDSHGIRALETEASCFTTSPSFKTRFVVSKTTNWFNLVDGEYLVEICFRESDSHDRISALCLQSSRRRSQWYGSAHGTIRRISAPEGYYIHMIHGSNAGGALRNLGVYFVPLSLRVITEDSEWVRDSELIGLEAYDEAIDESSIAAVGTVRAILVTMDDDLKRVHFLHTTEYERYVAVMDTPLDPGESVLVLTEGETVTALRACVVENCISAIQFATTLRTTEWFGPLPGLDAVIETRSIEDEPEATHIGGVFSMTAPDHLPSIGVMFYKQSS